MAGSREPSVKSRGERFAERPATRLWLEQPAPGNPYLAERCYCHGYELDALMAGRRFAEVFYLLFRGELPHPAQADLLERLMIALINPGPRHAATRAAMNAGIGRTRRPDILPIALAVQGGAHLGGEEVESAMGFLAANLARPPAETWQSADPSAPGDRRAAPGFGSRFGGIDPMAARLAGHLAAMPGAGPHLAWGQAAAAGLNPLGMGWLYPGVAAAALLDLGFSRTQGAGLYQIFSAPGLLAHGLEMAGRPITAMPFLDAEHYVIERD
ncbi:MAG: citrate synthase [Pseudomonadota bacterium]